MDFDLAVDEAVEEGVDAVGMVMEESVSFVLCDRGGGEHGCDCGYGFGYGLHSQGEGLVWELWEMNGYVHEACALNDLAVRSEVSDRFDNHGGGGHATAFIPLLNLRLYGLLRTNAAALEAVDADHCTAAISIIHFLKGCGVQEVNAQVGGPEAMSTDIIDVVTQIWGNVTEPGTLQLLQLVGGNGSRWTGQLAVDHLPVGDRYLLALADTACGVSVDTSTAVIVHQGQAKHLCQARKLDVELPFCGGICALLHGFRSADEVIDGEEWHIVVAILEKGW